MIRARNAAEMTTELLDVADDVRAAARRFLYKRKSTHPVDDIEDQPTAIAALASAFLGLSDFMTDDDRARLAGALKSELDLSRQDAAELMVLGRWLADQCGTPAQAVTCIAKRLHRLSGPSALEPLMNVIQQLCAEGISDRQRDALQEIRTAFRLR